MGEQTEPGGSLVQAGPNAEAAGYPIDQQTAAALLGLVYARLRVSVLLTTGVSLTFVGLMAPFFPWRLLAVWLGVLQGVSLGRYLLWRRFSRANPLPGECGPWTRLFVAGAVAAGGSWAFGPMLLIREAGSVETVLLVVTLLSVSSVAVATLSAQFVAMQAFVASALLPARDSSSSTDFQCSTWCRTATAGTRSWRRPKPLRRPAPR